MKKKRQEKLLSKKVKVGSYEAVMEAVAFAKKSGLSKCKNYARSR
jgi:3-hydroxyisobutyrate dehydrogenase-like beta-hydroxyacid dehydrogenase